MFQNLLSKALADAAERFGIRLALLFGSAVSGHLHENSDIDVAVLMKSQGLCLSLFSELYHELQSAVPDRKVDLSFLNHADPLFLKKITDSCRMLFGSERDLQLLKIYAFKRYQDHRRFLELERRYVRRFICELREDHDRYGTRHAQDALIGGDMKHLIRLAGMPLSDYLADPYAEVLAERYLSA